MRKNVFGRQFNRDANERKALFRGLLTSLILHERIKTTEEKAKAIKAEADKIITKAKKGEEKARYLLQHLLPKKAIDKVIFKILPRFDKRQGGYTRIIRIGRRFYDNAPLVLMEWTEQSEVKSSKLKVQSLDKTEGKDKEEEGVHDKKEKTLMKKEVRQLKSKTSKTKKE